MMLKWNSLRAGERDIEWKKKRSSNWSFELWSFFRAFVQFGLNLFGVKMLKLKVMHRNRKQNSHSMETIVSFQSVYLCPAADLTWRCAWCWITYDWSLLIICRAPNKCIVLAKQTCWLFAFFVCVLLFSFLFEMARVWCDRSARNWKKLTRPIIITSSKSRWSFHMIASRKLVLASTFETMAIGITSKWF